MDNDKSYNKLETRYELSFVSDSLDELYSLIDAIDNYNYGLNVFKEYQVVITKYYEEVELNDGEISNMTAQSPTCC